MESRKPIYQDLLKHISSSELEEFIKPLRKDLDAKLEVTELDEIDNAVYYNVRQQRGGYFRTALCCAVYKLDKMNLRDSEINFKIAKALLEVGANPNLTDDNPVGGSALLIATRLKRFQREMINTLLDDKKPIDIYVMDGLGRTAFNRILNRVGTEDILRLLRHDPVFAASSEEKKMSISTRIAVAAQSNKGHDIHVAISETIAKEYDYAAADEPKALSIINDVCQFTAGQPLGEIVLSYLFKKPPTLEAIERYALREQQRESENKRNNENRCAIS